MSAPLRTILFLICFTAASHRRAQRVPGLETLPDLETLIERAEKYVDGYEEQLGTLIGAGGLRADGEMGQPCDGIQQHTLQRHAGRYAAPQDEFRLPAHSY